MKLRFLIAGAFAVFAISMILILQSMDMPVGKVVWMEEGQKVEALSSQDASGPHTVELLDVAAGENRQNKLCGFLVNGEQIWIEEGKDDELYGVRIYVRDVVAVRDQLQDKDVCEVAIFGPLIGGNSSSKTDGDDSQSGSQNDSHGDWDGQDNDQEPDQTGVMQGNGTDSQDANDGADSEWEDRDNLNGSNLSSSQEEHSGLQEEPAEEIPGMPGNGSWVLRILDFIKGLFA
ncbi:MAG: hypothetical protein R6U32_00805 [Candidatus Woesearchaeota archaeon]